MLYTTTIMISITTVQYIHIQIQSNTKHGPILLFRYEPFINFWLRFFYTGRDTQFLKVFRNHTMLTSPPKFGTSRGAISISQHHGRTQRLNCLLGLQLLNTTIGLQLLNTMVGTQFLNTMVGPQLLHTLVRTQLNLFQTLSNSQPISSGHDVLHTPASFPVWDLSWQWWSSYPVRERKLHQLTTHLNS